MTGPFDISGLSSVVIYKAATGEIVSSVDVGFVDEFKDAQIAAMLAPWGDGHALMEAGGTTDTHYVAIIGEEKRSIPRPGLTVSIEGDKTTLLADGIDSITLTGLPDPCEIIIDDPDPEVETTVTEVTGGGFVFVADDPGVYTVEVRRWPFMPFRIEFTAE
jgi:hypothetical protein